jgi:hypothetical protein
VNAPSPAALDVVRDLRLDAIAEAARLAEHFAAKAAESARRGCGGGSIRSSWRWSIRGRSATG